MVALKSLSDNANISVISMLTSLYCRFLFEIFQVIQMTSSIQLKAVIFILCSEASDLIQAFSFGWLPQTPLLEEKGCHPLLPGSRCPGSHSTSIDTQERVSSFLLHRGGSPGSPHDYRYCGGKEETSSLLARRDENPSFLLSLPPTPPQW